MRNLHMSNGKEYCFEKNEKIRLLSIWFKPQFLSKPN